VNRDSAAEHSSDRQVEQEDKHVRHELATAKVVTTFSAAIAATFLATALQEGYPSRWDWVAAGLMLVTLSLTIWVVVTRRHPEHDIAELHRTRDASLKKAQRVHSLMVAQVSFSALTCVVAVVPVLFAVGGK
jgi:uncharacterized membrane protein